MKNFRRNAHKNILLYQPLHIYKRFGESLIAYGNKFLNLKKKIKKK